ncbi:MAG: histidinol dehydrogenase [Anaerolineales bacterium]|jgi:histidinol dehydrogenase
MLRIYDIETARRTILRRTPLTMMDFPPEVIAGTEQRFGKGVTPPEAVAQILRSVRLEGDQALQRWTAELDSIALDQFQIPAPQLAQAFDNIPTALRAAMTAAAERIRAFHALQPSLEWESDTLGGRLGQRVTPIESVGVYVPGGSAPLPSSLLMSVIPAQVAGVRQIVVCTPPICHPSILAAAHLCGIERVFQIGGSQAIAAMAFGTQSVPKVDKIVGAGNLFVTLAKQQVYGMVGIDGLAGPTETMLIADHTANPAWVAADLLAQAEHDVMASAILLTPDHELAHRVQSQVARQIEDLSRAKIIAQSLVQRSGIVVTPDLDSAAGLANDYAPEHLCLSVADPRALANQIQNAGGLFLGERSFEVLGDYVAGPSHVMPTGGTARFASPLNVRDFVKISSVIELDAATSREIGPLAAEFARAEGLTAHATAAEKRMEEG